MKKFFSVMLLTAVLIFANNQVEAAGYGEIYVGSYSDGTAVYLLTQTAKSNGRQGIKDYTCRVRAGRDYLFYHFWYENTGWEYDNNEGYSGKVYDGSSPVAASICDYLRRRFGG